MPSVETILFALALTLLAGMSTGLGGLLTLVSRRQSTRVLAFAMGLSAGVMIYISFMELLPEASEHFSEAVTAAWFFGGIGFTALIDRLVPSDENPHEMPPPGGVYPARMKRTGTMVALAIGIHNFPEGMATFVSALDGIDVALPIVAAIAVHNIPEGIAVFVPIYHSTGSRKQALRYTFLSGLAEPVGALAGMIFLMPFWSGAVNAACLAAVAGVMVYISFDELLPGAESNGHHHLALGGVVAGMAVMALTLIVL